ncbi:histidine phosphatase family protein [Streptomyces sp. V3I7]|uniref:histidine phosphatase family protein n=1 Tax=Streptomyces sp. V3I7 TaxID=3042278 RepID=UPI00278944AB|nr:histidine phosphatase family protein [Streptomyces sp. V3I7]MDQ0988954.1 broad specificity phosphatase PhoE [Streptomyces sp. V3I7]
MTSRVTLVSPAMNASLREARFDDGAPLDARGAAAARAAAGTLRAARRVLVAPTVRCRETASALGLGEAAEQGQLGGLDMGRWRGRTLDEVAGAEPEALAVWLADPEAAPHGGEPVSALCARAGLWLERVRECEGGVLAVVEPEFVRAAVVHALGAPETAFWRLDVAPLTATVLSGRAGRWNVRLGQAPDER